MYQLFLIVHILVAVFIIALVLVQQGKGATMGAAFGSGASSTVFGSRGSGSFLFRLTMGLAIAFFATSIGLNSLVTHYYKQEKAITLPFSQKTNIKSPVNVPVSPADNIPARK